MLEDGQRLLAALEERARNPSEGPCIVVLGERLRDDARARVLTALAEFGDQLDAAGIAVFPAIDDARAIDEVQAQVPEPLTIQFVFHRGLSAEHIRALAARACEVAHRVEQGPEDRAGAAKLTRILNTARAISSLDRLTRVTVELEQAVRDLANAERAHCLFHDAEQGTLWSEAEGDPRADELGAFRGLTGFAARTGASVHAQRADDDPRYQRTIDDPDGRGDESILVEPVRDDRGTVHVVLVAVRSQAPFTEVERAHVAELCRR